MAYGDQSNFSKEITAFTDQVMELETAINDVYNLRSVDTATWQTLNNIGDQVGQARPYGMSDSDYRSLVRAKIQMNMSGGEPERLIAAVEALTGALPANVQYTDYPGMVRIEYAGNAVANLWTFMKRLTAGGIGLQIVQNDATSPFRFDSGPGFDSGKLGNAITI